jgi:hypothetical protein
MSVRKWTIPLTLAGLGGLGAMLFSPRGRKLIHSAAERSGAKPGRMAAWNDSAQKELDHIQRELKELEHSIGTTIAR